MGLASGRSLLVVSRRQLGQDNELAGKRPFTTSAKSEKTSYGDIVAYCCAVFKGSELFESSIRAALGTAELLLNMLRYIVPVSLSRKTALSEALLVPPYMEHGGAMLILPVL